MNIQKRIQQSMRLIFIITMGYLLIEGKWERQAILASGLVLSYLPWMYEKIFKVKIPDSAQLLTGGFIFCAQYLGSFIGFYGRFPWWDAMLHFLSGFLLGYWGIVITFTLDKEMIIYKSRKIGLIIMIIVLTGIASAGVWEIIEFLGDCLIGTNAQLGSLRDTMEDIICGTIGGSLFAIYVGVMMSSKKEHLIDRLFQANIKGK